MIASRWFAGSTCTFWLVWLVCSREMVPQDGLSALHCVNCFASFERSACIERPGWIERPALCELLRAV
jgi:hypothetical protein